MSPSGQCPSAADWSHFVLGQSVETEVEQLEHHLAQCPSCVAVLHGLRCDDTLVDAIRGQQAANEPENVAVVELIARLTACPPPELRANGAAATVGKSDAQAADAATVPPVAAAAVGDETREVFECLAPPQAADEIGRPPARLPRPPFARYRWNGPGLPRRRRHHFAEAGGAEDATALPGGALLGAPTFPARSPRRREDRA